MPHQVWLRPYNGKDKIERGLFLRWLYEQRELNKFDPEMLKREQVKIYTLFDDEGFVGFTAISLAYVAEYQCWRPGVTDGVKAEALKSVQHFLVLKSAEGNVPNAFFRPSDERYSEFARRYGWKKDTLLALHFADLEAKKVVEVIEEGA
jgi:hypothetical protein